MDDAWVHERARQCLTPLRATAVSGLIYQAIFDKIVEAIRHSYAWGHHAAQVHVSPDMVVVDLGAGGLVVCDACNQDYSTSDEHGGVLIGSEGYGPCCAHERTLAWVGRHGGRPPFTPCPEGISFRQWMLNLRASRQTTPGGH